MDLGPIQASLKKKKCEQNGLRESIFEEDRLKQPFQIRLCLDFLLFPLKPRISLLVYQRLNPRLFFIAEDSRTPRRDVLAEQNPTAG